MRKRNKRMFFIIVGTMLVIQPILVAQTFIDRGYFAIGGEWFIFPTLYLLYELMKSFKQFVTECKKNI